MQLLNRQPNHARALIDVWHVLLRYPWRFLLPASLAAVAMLVVGLMLPRKYEAEATFDRRNDMVLAEMTHKGVPGAAQNPKASITEEIAGPAAIDRLLAKLQPEIERAVKAKGKSAPSTDRLREDLTRQVLVRFDISSADLDRIRVTFVHDEPDTARAVVNNLVLNYIERTRGELERRLRESAEFFETQAAREREALDTLEKQQLGFEVDNANLLSETTGGIQQQILSKQSELADIDQKRKAADLRIAALTESLKNTAETTPSVVRGRNPERERAETRVRELKAKLAEYVNTLKMTEKHPDVVDLKQQVADAEKTLKGLDEEIVIQRQTSVNPKRAEIELLLTTATAEREAFVARAREVTGQIDAFERQAGKVFPVRADYRKLTRQVEEHQRQRSFWEENLRRVKLALAAETDNRGVQLDFIKPCEELTRPTSPKLPQLAMVIVAVSLMTGAASLYLAHRTDESMHTRDQMAYTFNVPVLGGVSELLSKRQIAAGFTRRFVFAPAGLAIILAVAALLAAALYLDLERPDEFERMSRNPVQYVQGKLPGPQKAAASSKTE